MSLQEGKRIWSESLLSPEEWKKVRETYPQTCHLKEPPVFFKSEYEWRWRMGGGLTEQEITIINIRLDKLKADAGLVKAES